MSIQKSIIDQSNADIIQLLLPTGVGLTGATGSIPPYKSNLAYNLTDNKLKYGNGSTWVPLVTTINDYAAVVPQVATDQNILLINNTTNQIACQIADATHNGIVTATTQTFGGLKQFPGTIGIGPISANANISNIMPAYYRTTTPVAIVWDYLGLLFSTGPKASTINCERIGNMIYITVESVFGFPNGTPELCVSDIGIVPAEFRPASIQFSHAVCVNGYQDGAVILQMTSGSNTLLGGCFLNPQGRLTFGTQQGVRVGVLNNSGDTLYPFQGPLEVGFVKQTLAFSAL